MKNNLFSKATALVMGSLVIFSGQALAFSSNNPELTHTEVLGESELLIAQASQQLTPQEQVSLVNAIALAASALGDAAAVAQASSLTPTNKDAIARLISRASTIMGNLLAQSKSTALTKGAAASIVNSLSDISTIIGNAITIVRSDASGSARNVENSLARVQIAIGNVVAPPESVAR